MVCVARGLPVVQNCASVGSMRCIVGVSLFLAPLHPRDVFFCSFVRYHIPDRFGFRAYSPVSLLRGLPAAIGSPRSSVAQMLAVCVYLALFPGKQLVFGQGWESHRVRTRAHIPNDEPYFVLSADVTTSPARTHPHMQTFRWNCCIALGVVLSAPGVQARVAEAPWAPDLLRSLRRYLHKMCRSCGEDLKNYHVVRLCCSPSICMMHKSPRNIAWQSA